MRSKLIILLLFVATPMFAAGVNKVGTTAASFLEIGIGGKAAALGGAYVGMADDVSALYWNPAGVARSESIQMMFSYHNWLADLELNYGGVVLPLGNYGTLGLSGTFLTMAEMEVRTIENQEGTGEWFQAQDMAMGLTYAFNLTDRFSFGITGKYVQQKIWHCKARTFAFDLGTLFRTQFHGLRVGAVLYNFGNSMQMSGIDLMVFHDPDETKAGNNDRIISYQGTDEWELPLNFQAGIAIDLHQSTYHRVSLLTDVIHPADNQESINVGCEYAMNELVFLRGGWSGVFMDDSEEGITVGAGLKKRFGGAYLVIDYAYADFNRLESTRRFSFTVRF